MKANVAPFISLLACPLCGDPLTAVATSPVATSLYCPQKHTFDQAKEGYVNFLVGQPKFQGDSPEMLNARREFLASGLYLPLSAAINGMGMACCADLPQPVVAEVGCAEGWYLARWQENCPTAVTLGLDVAKTAVRVAAKQNQGLFFLVADTWQKLPFASGSLDLLLNIFAPRNPAEFQRVLKRNGRLLIVIPGPSHLQTLRTQFHLLEQEPNKESQVIEQLSPAFSLRDIRLLQYRLEIPQPTLTHLIRMTPNYRHLSPEQQTALETSPTLETMADFELLLFAPNKA